MSLSGGRELARVLPLRDLVLLIIGTVIGSGIFLVPELLLKAVGNSLSLALCGWLRGGVLSLLGALTYGEWSAPHPQAGGWYVYIRDCFGRPAFLFGWILFLVVTGSIATLAVAFSNYLRDIFPVAPWSLKLVSLAMIGIIAAVNIVGTRSADLQNVGTRVKLLGIVAIAGLLLGFSSRTHFQTVHSARYHAPGNPWTPPSATVGGAVFNTILAQAVRAAIEIGVVLTGAPASLIWRKG